MASDITATTETTVSQRPLCLLGFALYLAWASLVVPFERGLGVEQLSSALLRFYLITLLTVAVLLGLACFVRASNRHPWNATAAIACGALATLGGVLDLGVVSAPTAGVILDVCSISMRSVADAGMFVMWTWTISGQRVKTAWPSYALSMALASCLYFLLGAFGMVGVVGGVICLPMLSCILLARALRLKREGSPDDPRVAWTFPWRPVILMALFSFAFFLAGHSDGSQQPFNELGRFLVSLVVLGALVLAFDRIDVGLLYKVAPALMVAGLLLCSSGAVPVAGRLFVSFGYYGFTLFAWMALSEICYRYGAPAEWLFGVMQAVCLLCTIPGSAMGDALIAGNALPQLLESQTVFGVTIVALVLLSMLLMTSRTPVSTWGVKARGAEHAAHIGATGDGDNAEQAAAGDITMGFAEDRIARCALIARKYGLTHREEEVLSLVAQGLTFQQIEANLCIAHGTLRVHVQHIYAKMDVHSHDEMKAAVESFSGRNPANNFTGARG